MPRLVWSDPALRDVDRLYAFLTKMNANAARRAVKAIRAGVKELSIHPEMGRSTEGTFPQFREWVIEFGRGAYLALYHYYGEQIVVLAIRHGREAEY